ncbi:hypothetical protein [Bacillus sp. 2205SS5-2]
MTEHAVKPASRSGLAFDPSLRATEAGSRKAEVAAQGRQAGICQNTK